MGDCGAVEEFNNVGDVVGIVVHVDSGDGGAVGRRLGVVVADVVELEEKVSSRGTNPYRACSGVRSKYSICHAEIRYFALARFFGSVEQ